MRASGIVDARSVLEHVAVAAVRRGGRHGRSPVPCASEAPVLAIEASSAVRSTVDRGKQAAVAKTARPKPRSLALASSKREVWKVPIGNEPEAPGARGTTACVERATPAAAHAPTRSIAAPGRVVRECRKSPQPSGRSGGGGGHAPSEKNSSGGVARWPSFSRLRTRVTQGRRVASKTKRLMSRCLR